MQGRVWRSKYSNLVNETVLSIFLYYDDFEPGNALGSHAGEQEIGGTYVSCPFLPPHLVAKINNIIVASLFYKKHRQPFGSKAVFYKVIEEIQQLGTKGLTVTINGVQQTVYFSCALVVGNNLGLNCICGFTENFSATRYCRICRATGTECQFMSRENKSLLRTKENYDPDVRKMCDSTGLKERCIFNALPHFHITENKTVDIMHDLFEGVCSYTISKISGQKMSFLDSVYRHEEPRKSCLCLKNIIIQQLTLKKIFKSEFFIYFRL